MTMDNSRTALVLGATRSPAGASTVNRQPRDRGFVPERPHGKARSGSTRPALTPGSRRLAGVSAIYLMAPDGVPVGQAFVDEAVERGVERLVLLSSMSIEELADDRLLATERLVRGSGTAWTIVRANWFNRNFDEGFFQSCILAGVLAPPLGDVRQAFVDAEDVAAVAVEALVSEGHAVMTYEVTGPQALTFGDAIRAIAQEPGRAIPGRR